MATSKDVVVKEHVGTPRCLKRFLEKGLEAISVHNKVLRANYLRQSIINLSNYDTVFEVEVYTPGEQHAQIVSVTLNERTFQVSPRDMMYVQNQNFTNARNNYLSGHISKIKKLKCDGPYIRYLVDSSPNSGKRVAAEMILVAASAVYMNWKGLKEPEHQFINTFANGKIYMTLRHGVKPKLSIHGKKNTFYKIYWHRNSNFFPETGDKGFLVSGLYIHRPEYITRDSGGISFAKGSKEVRIFPKPGTVVTFFDQHVIHKVIPVRVNETSPTAKKNFDENLGFIQRTAVFMAWLTDSKFLSKATGENLTRFRKVGISVEFRNLKKLYSILKRYFAYIGRKKNQHLSNRPNITTFNGLFKNAPNAFIQGIYRGDNGTNKDKSNYQDLVTLRPSKSGQPVADIVLYKMVNSPGNNTPRRKLQNLYSVYKNLEESFGGQGPQRPEKEFARRGGRTQQNVTTANFIRLNKNENFGAGPAPMVQNNNRLARQSAQRNRLARQSAQRNRLARQAVAVRSMAPWQFNLGARPLRGVYS